MQFDINTNEVIKFTNKLDKLKKFDLPLAIRGTLNDAASDVKTNSMPKITGKTFKKRSPNFFKANSKFVYAQGFDVNKMRSEVGFFENKLVNQSTNFAVKELEQQEHGGSIGHKGFVAMKPARNSKGLVKPNARIKNLRTNAIDASKGAKSKKQNFVRAAFAALKNGKNVLGNKWKGNQTLSRIDSISSSIMTRKILIKRTPLYTFKKDRVVQVAGQNFMRRASEETGLQLPVFFIKNAEKRILKSMQ